MTRREFRPINLGCPLPPKGWWCSRLPGHDGPCAARPRWWNLSARARSPRL